MSKFIDFLVGNRIEIHRSDMILKVVIKRKVVKESSLYIHNYRNKITKFKEKYNISREVEK